MKLSAIFPLGLKQAWLTYFIIHIISDLSLSGTQSRGNNSQPRANDSPNANGLNNLASVQLESVDSRADTTAPQLYSTIPENYKQELSSSEKTQKHPTVNNTCEDH